MCLSVCLFLFYFEMIFNAQKNLTTAEYIHCSYVMKLKFNRDLTNIPRTIIPTIENGVVNELKRRVRH